MIEPSNLHTDETTSIAELRRELGAFVHEREWEPFHSPKNLAMSLAIEAAELMEHFQWITIEESRDLARDAVKRAAIGEELADVLAYLLALANALDLDVATAFHAKLAKNAMKYPVELSRGRHERPDPTTHA
jgi:NTP pyrophosphatase (non-canonical NTP hydrolase)